jgi:hypothetical protein
MQYVNYVTHPESVMHMLAEYSYAKSIWRALQSWIGVDLQHPPGNNYRRFQTWWNSMVQTQVHGKKERCRRVFDNRAMQANHLLSVIKDDVHQWNLAWRSSVDQVE